MNIIEKLRADPRIEIVDDERSAGNGVIITLRQGWTFDALQDNRVVGGDTATEARALLRRVSKFKGPFTP